MHQNSQSTTIVIELTQRQNPYGVIDGPAEKNALFEQGVVREASTLTPTKEDQDEC
jgi:hypothetical protein